MSLANGNEPCFRVLEKEVRERAITCTNSSIATIEARLTTTLIATVTVAGAVELLLGSSSRRHQFTTEHYASPLLGVTAYSLLNIKISLYNLDNNIQICQLKLRFSLELNIR